MAISLKRREFLATALAAITTGSVLGTESRPDQPHQPDQSPHPHQSPHPDITAHAELTIQQVIDLIIAAVPGSPFPDTVDTVKSGDPNQPVKGIVTTMFATDAVIEKAIKAGANFIIAHEPTFYNHPDKTDWLEGDKVYTFKKDLLEKNNIVVWRFHDYWHSTVPDGVLMGVLTAMGWDKYYNEGAPEMITIPAMTLGQIVEKARKQLGAEKMRMVGDLGASCQRILVMPGAAGGKDQIGMLRKYQPDLLICGEVHEWETAEYVRDARHQGLKMSLLVTGHAVSEEPGMEWLLPWLQPKVPGIKITHIPSGGAFVTI